MNPTDEEKLKVTIRAVSRDEEGKKRVQKIEIESHDTRAIKHVEKKLVDKGVQRLDRHPVHAPRAGIAQAPPKAGRGGRFTWEGPGDAVDSELWPAPTAIDEKDPNYVEEEEKEAEEVAGLVIGEVEVAAAAEGVSRVEVDPRLQLQ